MLIVDKPILIRKALYYPEHADIEVIMVKFRKFFLKSKNTQVERENRARALLLFHFTEKAIKDEGG